MKIAFIGTGLMGKPMAERLAEHGHTLSVYNRTKSKAEGLSGNNVTIADSVKQAADQSEVIILMLSDFYAVSNSLFSEKIDYSGKTVINMSTIAPGENLIIKERIEKVNGEFIEAPVLGSIPQVKEGKLFVIAGCTPEQFKNWREFFEAFGEKIIFMGEVGKASVAKLALNQLISTLTAAFSTSLGLVIDNGIDVEKFMDILRSSALHAPTFDKKLESYLNRDFSNPNFPLKHLLKDVNLFLNEAKRSKINTAQLEGVRDIIKSGLEMRMGELDYSSLFNAVYPENK